MDNKFVNLYSKNKRSVQEKDVVSLPISITNVYFTNRYNNFIYNTNNENIHYLRFFEKNTKSDFFYFNRYKTIKESLISYLPFDTNHFITQEIVGHSVFVQKIDKKRYFYNKYSSKCFELENILHDDIYYKYFIDKYAKQYTLEFKLYNKEVYLVNMFNTNSIVTIDTMQKFADQFNIKTPKKIKTQIFKKGKKQLDNFYNDYYLNVDNFIYSRNYYVTFYFKNNKILLYKL